MVVARRLFFILSEAILIFLSAILGTFAWNHLSPVFNSLDWWDKLMQDIANYWQAYLTISVVFGVLVVVLYYRAKKEDDANIQKLTTSINNLITEIQKDRNAK